MQCNKVKTHDLYTHVIGKCIGKCFVVYCRCRFRNCITIYHNVDKNGSKKLFLSSVVSVQIG